MEALREIAGQAPISRRYGDFHPGHVYVTQDGKLALIDPNIATRYRYPYHDMGLFIAYLFTVFSNRLTPFGRPTKQEYGILRDAFIEGYQRNSSWRPSDKDRLIIEGCEAYSLRKNLRSFWKGKDRLRLVMWWLPLRRKLRASRRSMEHGLESAR